MVSKSDSRSAFFQLLFSLFNGARRQRKKRTNVFSFLFMKEYFSKKAINGLKRKRKERKELKANKEKAFENEVIRLLMMIFSTSCARSNADKRNFLSSMRTFENTKKIPEFFLREFTALIVIGHICLNQFVLFKCKHKLSLIAIVHSSSCFTRGNSHGRDSTQLRSFLPDEDDE